MQLQRLRMPAGTLIETPMPARELLRGRAGESQAWVRLLGVGALPSVLGLVALGAAYLWTQGRFNLAFAGIMPPLLVMAVVALFRGRVAAPAVADPVDLEPLGPQARRLLLYSLGYTAILVPLAVFSKAVPTPLLPGTLNSPVVSAVNVFGDKVLLLSVPSLLFAWAFGGLRRQLGIEAAPGGRRWLAPSVAIGLLLVWQVVLAVRDLDALTPGVTIALLAISFAYAGFPEEIYYRVLLQTRLELLLGSRAGIAVSSLLFGLRHVPIRYVLIWLGTTGSPVADLGLAVSVMLCVQVPFGIAFGCLWSSYRNVWMNVGGHTAYDFLNFVSSLG